MDGSTSGVVMGKRCMLSLAVIDCGPWLDAEMFERWMNVVGGEIGS
jgi:hypothetical protein